MKEAGLNAWRYRKHAAVTGFLKVGWSLSIADSLLNALQLSRGQGAVWQGGWKLAKGAAPLACIIHHGWPPCTVAMVHHESS